MLKEFLNYFKLPETIYVGSNETINSIHQIPVSINLFFSLISIGSKNTYIKNNNPGRDLCKRYKEWVLHL